jgi:hypothetical protein
VVDALAIRLVFWNRTVAIHQSNRPLNPLIVYKEKKLMPTNNSDNLNNFNSPKKLKLKVKLKREDLQRYLEIREFRKMINKHGCIPIQCTAKGDIILTPDNKPIANQSHFSRKTI